MKMSNGEWKNHFINTIWNSESAILNKWQRVSDNRNNKWFIHMQSSEDMSCYPHCGRIVLYVETSYKRIKNINYKIFYVDNFGGGHSSEILFLSLDDAEFAAKLLEKCITHK